MNQDAIEQNVTERAPLPVFTPSEQHKTSQSTEAACNIAALGKKAFRKALTSLIMAVFPITSAIAIFTSKRALKISKRASKTAEDCGVRSGGKVIASKIISIIALALSIIFTCFYLYYLLYFVLILSQINQIYQIAGWIVKIVKMIF